MILVSGLYAVLWLPHHLLLIFIKVRIRVAYFYASYYTTLFLAFLYTTGNPFIYATKFEPVKRVLRDRLRCRKAQFAASQVGTGFAT